MEKEQRAVNESGDNWAKEEKVNNTRRLNNTKYPPPPPSVLK